MPELPEVETTVRGLRNKIVGLKILDVWTDLNTKDKRKKSTVADPKYFPVFKREVKNKKIISVERQAKNILINLSEDKTILVHLKLTGYLFYGQNPHIKYAHAIFTLSSPRYGGASRQYLVLSDMRKFGKITLLDTKTAHDTKHLKDLGPDPLDKNFDLEKFRERLAKKPNGKIKTVLMDQSVLAGIGNIYSDEILWRAGIHPERKISTLLRQGSEGQEIKELFKAMKETLAKGISFGGDSMSDYRNIYGQPGKFQLHHEAYRRTGEKCRKKDPRHGGDSPRRGGASCKGVIMRKVINGRSGHFCPKHQTL